MEKYFVYKDAYVNDEYFPIQENPDICDTMECAIETVIDAVKHLTGIDLSEDEIEMFDITSNYKITYDIELSIGKIDICASICIVVSLVLILIINGVML